MDALTNLCCPTYSKQEDGRIRCKLQSNAIPIFWQLRCTQNVRNSSSKDLSPFPREWSINYSGNSREDETAARRDLFSQEFSENDRTNIQQMSTDESSVYSTVSQEHRANRDEFGNCKLHPHIQLAKKRHANRFSRMFTNSTQEEEWIILHNKCPQCCRVDHENKECLRGQAITNPVSSRSSESFNFPTYTPIPASITLISSHHKIEGTDVLKVRTEPIPLKIFESICCPAPDGVIDTIIPCDSAGMHLDYENTEYKIMERHILLSSIDHVSRGGDAWDVLRASTGEDDLGCRCDVKIHGFSDRLLRFDVVNFDGLGSGSSTKRGVRYSFVSPDFMKSSASSKNSKAESLLNQEEANVDYSPGNVISELNHLVMMDRERRKSGSIEALMNTISLWADEFFGLGAPTKGKDSTPVATNSGHNSVRNGRDRLV